MSLASNPESRTYRTLRPRQLDLGRALGREDLVPFPSGMTPQSLGIMTVLALLANVCYGAVYFAEILIQNVTSSAAWNRQR
jgi:hypothetical protein